MENKPTGVVDKVRNFLSSKPIKFAGSKEYINATYGARTTIDAIISDTLTDIRNTIESKSNKHQYSIVWEIDTHIPGLEEAILKYLDSNEFTVKDMNTLITLPKRTIFVTWLPL